MEVLDDTALFQTHHNEVKSYNVQEAMAEHIQDRAFRQLIWNKLYRREMIGQIRFPVGKKIDDEFFTYQVLGNAKTLIRSDQVCYAYRQQRSSVMHSMDAQKRLQAVEAKVQRDGYIREKFPELADLSRKNLWFTCIYQGQLAMRELNAAAAKKTITYLEAVMTASPICMRKCSAKEKLWLALANCSLAVTCSIRNALKIGL